MKWGAAGCSGTLQVYPHYLSPQAMPLLLQVLSFNHSKPFLTHPPVPSTWPPQDFAPDHTPTWKPFSQVYPRLFLLISHSPVPMSLPNHPDGTSRAALSGAKNSARLHAGLTAGPSPLPGTQPPGPPLPRRCSGCSLPGRRGSPPGSEPSQCVQGL